MPIYEFECSKCKTVFEFLFRSRDDKSIASCPACRSKKTKKLLSVCRAKVEGSSYDFNSGGSGSSCGSCAGTSCSTCGH